MNKILLLSALLFTQTIFGQIAIAPTGTGTTEDPYLISGYENLYWVSQNRSEWGKVFKQVAHINMEAVEPAIATWDGNQGWSPIGTGWNEYAFTGTYDGNGFGISGIVVNRSGTDNVGVFGFSQGGTIKNLSIYNVTIAGKNHVGGIVGYNTTNATITNCLATGTLSGFDRVGGVVGFSRDRTTIQYCYADVDVTGHLYVGGFAGQNNQDGGVLPVIADCYAKGDVITTSDGDNRVGAFVGENYDGTVQRCYSTGSVTFTGGQYLGYLGFIGKAIGVLVLSDNYYDNETSNQTSAVGATEKTSLEMKTQATFAGWDFINAWEIIGGDGANYPTLKNNPSLPLPVELSLFAAQVGKESVSLNWQTETETNNYGFEIERSSAKNEGFEKVGFVTGNGNSNSVKYYAFTDKNPVAGKTVYRLKQIDYDGKYEYSKEIEVLYEGVKEFALEQNYPNPFNPTTIINYSIPEDAHVSIKVYNILGREISTLVNRERKGGSYSVEFNGADLASGVYVYSIKSGAFAMSKRMMLIK